MIRVLYKVRKNFPLDGSSFLLNIVNFKDSALTKILRALDESAVDDFSRANFVSDYFAFSENPALTGISITDTFEYTQFLKNDLSYASWLYFNEGISFVHGLMKFTSNKDLLNSYLEELSASFYEKAAMHTASANDLKQMK